MLLSLKTTLNMSTTQKMQPGVFKMTELWFLRNNYTNEQALTDQCANVQEL